MTPSTEGSGSAAASGARSASAASSSASGSGSDVGALVGGSTYFDLYHALAARAQNEDGEGSDGGTLTTVTDDYCMFNATETESSGCKKPRSCAACFRVQGCMLNATGSCVSAALHYNESEDFRVATLYKNETLKLRTSYDYWNTTGAARRGTVQSWVFPSTLVDYCAPGDTACELCRLSVFADAGGSPDMRYCVGASGCVCTALCESPQLEDRRHNQTVCDASKAPTKQLPASAMWVIGSSVAIVVAGLLYWWMWRRTSESRGDDECNDDGSPDHELVRRLALKGRHDKSVGGSAGATSLPSVFLVPQAPDTPVMELSLSEYPRFSMESSRRRQPPAGSD